MPTFSCQSCGKDFEVPQAALDKYPSWTPRTCLACRDNQKGTGTKRKKTKDKKKPVRAPSREENLTVAEVLEKYTEGPSDGVFTDGAAHPNPGAGGWGAVYVVDGEVVRENWGHEPHTTNNRMELRALIEGFQLVPPGTRAKVWTDSQLCVKTITEWARGWECRGWKRKTGEIKNLDLVKELYALAQARPELELAWVPGHAGYRWNEYADALATAYRRSTK